MKKNGLLILIFTIISIIAVYGCADLRWKMSVVKTLLDLNNNEKNKDEVFRQETLNFGRAKEYITGDSEKKDIYKDNAIEKFGEPVLIFAQREREREKWAYKPRESSWFKGEKIYLYFDNTAKLIDWECVDIDCPVFVK